MTKSKETLRRQGEVIEVLGGDTFRILVKLGEDKKKIIAYKAARFRDSRGKRGIVLGDKVIIESPLDDLGIGKIVASAEK